MWIRSRDDQWVYAAFDVVLIAASAGGIEALLPLLANLPVAFPAPVVVVQHLPPVSRHVSRLAQVLQRHTHLKVKWAENRERLVPGRVYLAPQDRSTVFDEETGAFLIAGADGGKLERPTADPLFCSAAQVFGSRSLAVVLSGVLSDGADGAAAIALAGGRVLAQTAAEAQFKDMPLAAMQRSRVGLPFDSAALARVIGSLVMSPGAAAWFGIGKAGVGGRLIPRINALPGGGANPIGAVELYA